MTTISAHVPKYTGNNQRRINKYENDCRIAEQITNDLNDKIAQGKHGVIFYEHLAMRYGVAKSEIAIWLYHCGGSENSIKI